MELFLKSLFFISVYLHVTKGCNIDGVTNWLLPITKTILDTYSGTIFDGSTSDIEGISNIIHNEGLNAGPYVTVEFTDNNRLIIFTNSNYTIYEELETAMSFTFSVTLNCLGGTRRILVFEINVSDTNNNDPQFKPTNNYEFAIAPPLPPGFLITNCINDMIVRDIDLTTERIDFTIEGSPLFEIVNSESSSVPKEFKAVLRTTTFIRSIPDPIILTVTATDVDRTNDPPRYATATVKLFTDGEFLFPDEPIFSQTFYLASYNTDDGFVLEEYIYLREGFDTQVVFSFETQHSQYFKLIVNENQVSFKANALPEELYKERQLYIIVKAERQYTSGATATVILQLPDEPETEDDVEFFDKVLYKGHIEDGVANHEVITITGYNGSSVLLFGEYASSFKATLLNDKITVIPIASATLPSEKSHIAIALQAGRANAVLVFEIIPSGSEVEPIESFDEVLYRGTLNNGVVTHETITLSEYKDSEVLLSGDYAPSFEASYLNGIVSVQARTSATIPTELTHIALTLQAGTAISVLLLNVQSSEPEIESFDKILYKGSLENGIVSHDAIILSNYDQSNIQLFGDYASSFESSVYDGKVSVQTRASASLPSNLTHVVLTLQAGIARAVLVLEVNEPGSETDNIESFDKVLYVGYLNNYGVISHDAILLSDYTESNIILSGDYASSFESSWSNGKVLVQKRISANLPPEITHITLTLQAGRARAVLVLEVIESGSEIDVSATFDKILYTGKLEDGIVLHETITIRDFSGSNVLIAGVYAPFFESSLSNGVVKISARASVEIPTDLTHIALTLQAERATAVLLLDIIETGSEIDTIESFDKVLYNGNVRNGVVSHDDILLFDYTDSTIILSGDYATSFDSTSLDGKVLVHKRISATLPPEINHTTLTLKAGRARAVLVLEIIQSGTEIDVSATFDKILYAGKMEDGNVLHETITIRDFSGPNILITGVHATLFESSLSNGVVTIRVRASVEFPTELTHIALTLQAERASAVLLLDVIVTGSEIDTIESFDKVLYNGNLNNGVVSHDVISLSDYTESTIILSGDYASSFESSLSDGKVLVQKRISATLPPEITHITLTLQAGRARAVLVVEVTESGSENDVNATFDKILYIGKLKDENVSHETINIRDFSGSNILITGDYASSFESSISNGVVSVRASASSVLPSDLTHVTLILQAARARSVLLLEVVSGSTPEEVEAFDKILYTGSVINGFISHEVVSISQYNGNILLSGEHASLFESSLSNGVVSVTVRTSAIFPTDLTHTALTLQAGRARAVLLLDITTSNDQPSVTFDKPSYFLWADFGQTGIVGRVSATVNNGDTVIYSLEVNDDHLRSRITVNNDGAISLSDVAQVGDYTFSITATAQNSQASASAPVTLRVYDLPQCPVGKGLPPLIVLERLEEEPHRNLVTLNRTEYPDCRYSLSNSWPVDQSWLYIDNDGLHAEVIDREHKSIAFMTLSQIQVELRLHCDNDEAPTTKRSLTAERLELGSDNYGSNRWVLADTIEYEERRSFVNLIVNDINDNPPIFIGKNNEPIYIGYPIPEIEDVVLPRALIEVKATDADIGENAALIYWSTVDFLAVAPLTGLVHVRNNAQLQDNSLLTVIATDQNGRGLNGTLDFVVMLLDKHQIAVVTIQDAFLDDENIVIGNLSSAIGYELKVLRTVVVSESNENTLRKKRDVTSGSGASLQIYVYGVEENKPVDVTKLTSDITNSNIVTVSVARALSLQDHLDSIETCLVQGIGLLVATIILAVLLLIVILGIALWFFLKWRKTNNYEKFSDRNSVVSRSETAEFPKIENIIKPRLNISELKRSERRLQEMLDIPIQEVRMEPEKEESNQTEPPPSRETIVNFSTPEKPIVIQSIDKLKDNDDESEGDDEFGEQQKQKPRKSVVTFNENVEKIIHLEDGIDSPESDIEIFRF